jgi:hypothetical protein
LYGGEIGGKFGVVKTGDAKIIGHAESGFMHGGHGADSQHVK